MNGKQKFWIGVGVSVQVFGLALIADGRAVGVAPFVLGGIAWILWWAFPQ